VAEENIKTIGTSVPPKTIKEKKLYLLLNYVMSG
jgi:hypothetical protein